MEGKSDVLAGTYQSFSCRARGEEVESVVVIVIAPGAAARARGQVRYELTRAIAAIRIDLPIRPRLLPF